MMLFEVGYGIFNIYIYNYTITYIYMYTHIYNICIGIFSIHAYHDITYIYIHIYIHIYHIYIPVNSDLRPSSTSRTIPGLEPCCQDLLRDLGEIADGPGAGKLLSCC